MKYFTGSSFEDLVTRHISSMDPCSMFRIPNLTILRLNSTFRRKNLAIEGLVNDGNSCCLLSILSAFNRMQLPSVLYKQEGNVG